MTDRPRGFSEANLGLGVAVAISLVLILGVALGPGRQHLAGLRSEFATRRDEWTAFQLERAEAQPLTAHQRAAWSADRETLERRVAVVAGDAELMARVAESLEAPGVRDVRVRRRSSPMDSPQEMAAENLFGASPSTDIGFEMTPIAITVRFSADYAEAAELFRRIEAHELPARIDSLRVQRDFPGVSVAIDLTWFVRWKAAS